MPQHAHRFLQPVFSVRYQTDRTKDLATFPPGISHKHQLGALVAGLNELRHVTRSFVAGPSPSASPPDPTHPSVCVNTTTAEASPGLALEHAILKHMIPTRGDIDPAFLSQFR